MSTVTISAGLPARASTRSRRTQPAHTQPARVQPVRTQPVRTQPARTRAAAPVRLTRRGRLAATLVLIAGFLAGGVLLAGGLATAGTEPGAAATAQRITVAPGETLWGIAEREAPGTDPRDTVAEILELNHLQSSAVEAGSVLLLP